MSEKEKIKKYLEYKGISKSSFYKKTGLSVGFLDSGNSLGVDKLKIIIMNFPDINLEWMVLDNGDMIKPHNPIPILADSKQNDNKYIESLEDQITTLKNLSESFKDHMTTLKKENTTLKEQITYLEREIKFLESAPTASTSEGVATSHMPLPGMIHERGKIH